jgi:hypothetical protein
VYPKIAFLLALLATTSATASPLAANTSHVGEDHSFEVHASKNLKGIDLSESDVTSTDFSSCDLRDALFVDAMVSDALFTSADLKDADLTGADLTRVDFTGAILKDASLADALLSGATLASANIKNADFSGAHLIGADLSNVGDGHLAIFDGAYIDDETLLAPSIDDSAMWFVVGLCAGSPTLYWVDEDRDGDGDACHGVSPLPEPGTSALVAGLALLTALARRGRRSGY